MLGVGIRCSSPIIPESPVDQKAPLIVEILVLIFYIFSLFLRTSQSSMHAIVVVIYFAMIEDWDIARVFKDYFLLCSIYCLFFFRNDSRCSWHALFSYSVRLNTEGNQRRLSHDNDQSAGLKKLGKFQRFWPQRSCLLTYIRSTPIINTK